MKKIHVMVCLMMVVSMLFGCQARIDEDWAAGLDSYEMVLGANLLGTHSTVSVHEKGVFYISTGGQLSYYDYSSDDCYILCSIPSCAHLSTDCVACVGSRCAGFALYGQNAYYMRPNSDHPYSMWEFVRVDIANQTAEILCSFGSDGSEVNQWWCNGVHQVSYSAGYAWVDISLFYYAAEDEEQDNVTQMLAIDLDTGAVTELTPHLSTERGYGYTSFEYFDEEHTAISMQRYKERYLSEKEYLEQYGETPEVPYEEYLDRYFTEQPRIQQHILIDVDTLEQTVIREHTCERSEKLVWMDDGEPVYWMPEKLEDGSYNTHFNSVNADGSVVQKGYIEGSDLCAWFLGDLIPMYDGDSFLYAVDPDENTREVWRYNIQTGRHDYLCAYALDDPFMLCAQTEDKLVGMLDGNTRYAWIYKSDYEQGNFDALHEFSIG